MRSVPVCLLLAWSCATAHVYAFVLPPQSTSIKQLSAFHEAARRRTKNILQFQKQCRAGPLSATTYQLDPDSEQARAIAVDHLGLSEDQYEQLKNLSFLVTEWNERINLISRKDCNPSTVFGRHVLPSLACCAMAQSDNDNDERITNPFDTAKRAIDVGTGGGFPGLPLAIAYPHVDFVLLDSVGKKLTAVQEMAQELGLSNVQIHHGRAEESFRTKNQDELFDVVTGRSVSSIPQFCAWMHHLLRRPIDNDGDTSVGHLLYWIGGDISETTDMLENASTDIQGILSDTPVEELLTLGVESDKRILVIPQETVSYLAKKSGLIVAPPKRSSRGKKKRRNKQPRQAQQERKRPTKARGGWDKKGPDEAKQRGYEDFQRYSSQ